jgi:endoglucanase
MRSSRRWVAALAAALVLAVAASACGYVPGKDGGRPARSAPATGALLGTFTEPARHDRAGQEAAIQGLERAMGRKLGIAHWFYPWDSPFPTWRETWAHQGGRLNMVSWGNGPTSVDVAAGRFDRMIDDRARGMKAFGKPILLRWFGEMDSATLRAKAGTPAQFIAAWRRMYNRFTAAGATNVEFVWCPNAWAFETGTAVQWYPGDAYVQWTCADGYNWAPAKPGADWLSFERTYRDFYAWASKKQKPIVIGEVGAVEDPRQPGRKAQWIQDLASTVRAWPRIKAVVWFDATADTRSDPGKIYDWRLNSSARSLAAWRDIGWWRIFHPPR